MSKSSIKKNKNKKTSPVVESLNYDEDEGEILMGDDIEIPPNAKVLKVFHFD